MFFTVVSWAVMGLTFLLTVALLWSIDSSSGLSSNRPVRTNAWYYTLAGWGLMLLALTAIGLVVRYLLVEVDWSKGLPTSREAPMLFGLSIVAVLPWFVARFAWFEAEVVRMNAADPDRGKKFMAAFTKAKAEHEAMMERDRLTRENEPKSRGRGPEPKPYDIDHGSET